MRAPRRLATWENKLSLEFADLATGRRLPVKPSENPGNEWLDCLSKPCLVTGSSSLISSDITNPAEANRDWLALTNNCRYWIPSGS